MAKEVIRWEPFDDFGGYNPKGKHLALIINEVEIFDFWANGLITTPVGSPAELRGKRKKMKWRIGRQ